MALTDNPGVNRVHARFRAALGVLLILIAFPIMAACDGGESPSPFDTAARTPLVEDQQDQPVEPPPVLSTPTVDEQEILALARAFFTALIEGDSLVVWALLAEEVQANITLAQVGKSTTLIAAAYQEPGFVLEGFRFLTIDGDRATFILDAYITDYGTRIGNKAEAEASPPLYAVREGVGWRLIPDVALLTLSDLTFGVEAE